MVRHCGLVLHKPYDLRRAPSLRELLHALLALSVVCNEEIAGGGEDDHAAPPCAQSKREISRER
jgi:hypothetical protein